MKTVTTSALPSNGVRQLYTCTSSQYAKLPAKPERAANPGSAISAGPVTCHARVSHNMPARAEIGFVL